MKFNYNDLCKILIVKNMKNKDLIKSTGISPITISKMTKGESVYLLTLKKLCGELNSDIGDIVCLNKKEIS